MLHPEKTISLKNGKTALLRSPRVEDAKALLNYMKITSSETPYLLRTPDECTITLAQEEAFLFDAVKQPFDVMLLCFVDGELAGSCRIIRHTKAKTRHRADVMIALYQKFWNLGIGSAMFREMITLAESWDLIQLELEVIEGNDRAIALYNKMGFQTVAAMPDAILLSDGRLLKEYKMIKTLQKGLSL